jgi:uncharacterized repeat protein (TIGR02543 family)
MATFMVLIIMAPETIQAAETTSNVGIRLIEDNIILPGTGTNAANPKQEITPKLLPKTDDVFTELNNGEIHLGYVPEFSFENGKLGKRVRRDIKLNAYYNTLHPGETQRAASEAEAFVPPFAQVFDHGGWSEDEPVKWELNAQQDSRGFWIETDSDRKLPNAAIHFNNSMLFVDSQADISTLLMNYIATTPAGSSIKTSSGLSVLENKENTIQLDWNPTFGYSLTDDAGDYSFIDSIWVTDDKNTTDYAVIYTHHIQTVGLKIPAGYDTGGNYLAPIDTEIANEEFGDIVPETNEPTGNATKVNILKYVQAHYMRYKVGQLVGGHSAPAPKSFATKAKGISLLTIPTTAVTQNPDIIFKVVDSASSKIISVDSAASSDWYNQLNNNATGQKLQYLDSDGSTWKDIADSSVIIKSNNNGTWYSKDASGTWVLAALVSGSTSNAPYIISWTDDAVKNGLVIRFSFVVNTTTYLSNALELVTFTGSGGGTTDSAKLTFANDNKPSWATGTLTKPNDSVVTKGTVVPDLATQTSLTGWIFGGWYAESGLTTQLFDSAGKTQASKTGYTTATKAWDSTGTVDRPLYAKWTADSYAITLNGNDPTTAGTASIIATYDSNVVPSFTKPQKTGYTLTGFWDSGANGNKVLNADGSFDSTKTVANWTYKDGNTQRWRRTSTGTLYAQWSQNVVHNSQNLTFSDSKPAAMVPTVSNKPQSFQVTNGSVVANTTAPTANPAGWNFGGWYVDSAWTNQLFDSDGKVQTLTDYTNAAKEWLPNLTTAVPLYAKWTARTDSITFDTNKPTRATSTVTPATVAAKVVTYDSTISDMVGSVSMTGWNFHGWYTDSGTSTGTTNRVFGTDSVVSATVGTTITGSKWKGLANLTTYAHWTPKTYTISFDTNKPSGAPGTVGNVPEQRTVTYDSAVPAVTTYPTLPGYIFDGWYRTSAGADQLFANSANNGATQNYTGYIVDGNWRRDGNITVYAKWTPKTYNINYSSTIGTNMPPNKTGIAYNSILASITPPTPPASPRQRFLGFSIGTAGDSYMYDSNGSAKYLEDVVDADKKLVLDSTNNYTINLTARWIQTFLISFVSNGGTPAAPTQTVDTGTQAINPTVTGRDTLAGAADVPTIQALTDSTSSSTNGISMSDPGFMRVGEGEGDYIRVNTNLIPASHTSDSWDPGTIPAGWDEEGRLRPSNDRRRTTVVKANIYPRYDFQKVTPGTGNFVRNTTGWMGVETYSNGKNGTTATEKVSTGAGYKKVAVGAGSYKLGAALPNQANQTSSSGWYDYDYGYDNNGNHVSLQNIYGAANATTRYKMEYVGYGTTGDFEPAIDGEIVEVPHVTGASGSSMTKLGYEFQRWATDRTYSTAAAFAPIVTHDDTYYAQWRQTVELNNHDGTPANDTFYATYDSALPDITPPEPAHGMGFTGYYTAANGNDMVIDADGHAVTTNTNYFGENGRWTKEGATVLHAHYETTGYQVTYSGTQGAFRADDQTTAALTSGIYDIGTVITLPTLWKLGYTWDGWYNSNNEKITSLTVSNPVTIYARFEGENRTISFNDNFGAFTNVANTIGTKTIKVGNAIATGNLLAGENPPQMQGHTFDGFATTQGGTTYLYNSAGVVQNSVANITEDGNFVLQNATTVFAHWTPRVYTFTGLPAGQTVTFNTAPTATVAKPAAQTGYDFQGYKTGSTVLYDSAGNLLSNTALTSNAGLFTPSAPYDAATTFAFSPVWVAKNYAVTLDAGAASETGFGGANFTPNNVTSFTYEQQLPAALTAAPINPEDALAFAGFKISGTDLMLYNANGSLNKNVAGYTRAGDWIHDGPVTLIAQWVLSHKVSFNTGTPYGTTELPAKFVPEGQAIGSYPAVNRSGSYTLDGWYDNAAFTTKLGNDFVPTANTTVYAKWTQTLKIDLNGGTANTNTKIMVLDSLTPWILPANIASRPGYTLEGYFCEDADDAKFYNANGSIVEGGVPGCYDEDGIWIHQGKVPDVYAKWTADSYEVSFDTDLYSLDPEPETGADPTHTYDPIMGDVEGEEIEDSTATHGDAVDWSVARAQLPSTIGYAFEGFYTGLNGTGVQIFDASGKFVASHEAPGIVEGGKWVLTGNVVLHAKWKPSYVNVRFDNNPTDLPGEIEDGAQDKILLLNSTFDVGSLDEPTLYGYDFAGWYTNADLAEAHVAGATVTVTPPMNFYAKWTPKICTIHYYVYGQSQTDTTQLFNTLLIEPAPPTKTDYRFEGWYTTSNFEPGTKFIFKTPVESRMGRLGGDLLGVEASEGAVTGDLSLYANFVEPEPGEEVGAPNDGDYRPDKTVPVSAILNKNNLVQTVRYRTDVPANLDEHVASVVFGVPGVDEIERDSIASSLTAYGYKSGVNDLVAKVVPVERNEDGNFINRPTTTAAYLLIPNGTRMQHNTGNARYVTNIYWTLSSTIAQYEDD